MKLSLKGWILFGCFLPLWLLVLVLGLGGWLLKNHFDAMDRQMLERGQLTLKHLGPSLVNSLAETDRSSQIPRLRQLVDQLLEAPDVRAFSLYDHRQTSLLHAGPSMRSLELNPDARWNRESVTAVERETVRFIEPLYALPTQRLRPGENNPLVGWAELELNRSSVLLDKYRLLLLGGGLVTGLLLFSLMLTHLLVQHLQRYLEQMGVNLQRFAEGESLQQADTEAVVELNQLQQAVHSMAEVVQQREASYRQAIEETREDAQRSLETIEIKNIELDRARKDALQASRIKSEFLANMSHEIRTPLNGIIGFSNLLSRTRLESRQKEYLTHILGASETMLGIINDILDFSKIEAGMMVLEEVPIDLRELLADSLSLQAPHAHRQGLELLGLVYDDVPAVVRGDPLRLKQLLGNLVSNALKFTGQGEVVVRIMLDDEKEGAAVDLQPGKSCRLRFAVSDTGIGLSEPQRQKLFRAFTQADASQARQFGGTGLGLAICKQLVQQMGGDIDLESAEGVGSTFWFSLPMQLLDMPPEAQPWLTGKTFGVLETHRLTNQSWCHLLRSWGAQVLAWDSPEKMLQAVADEPQLQAVVIGLSARQAASPLWLDAIGQLHTRKMAGLLLVNSSEAEIHQRLRQAGGLHLLTKPLLPKRFCEALKSVMEQRKFPDQGLLTLTTQQPATQKQPVILAVDDTPSNLLLLVTLLEQLGFATLQAKNGVEALELVQQQVVDLVLMDIQMPEMNGVQATRHIRRLGQSWRTLPVIALTAHAVAEEREKWLEAGINDVLIKPLDERQLVDLLQRWLGDRYQTPGLPVLPEPNHSEEAWQTCPVDRELGIKLAAGRTELADELLAMLLSSLQQSRDAIEAALRQQNDQSLLDAVHRLHGASRYCGVPDLAQTTEALETQLKAGQQQLVARSLEQLFYEIDRLQDWKEREYRTDWHQDG
ncbi:response regulator [Marinospirillum alkaliphilum]|uniref:histidine kinase n=1 Tax=Marinospirillum alkaliphilum DSM 21637 TaxID=1122209 RepID=A0A1K1TET8_9GAMM|nr:response regulator [Marinospirillum alkaliphilum]SFW98940.1 two-component system, NarL family, sensor histidine kinase BarA [Marinospirillum alkaliphilum DSM 21637]